MRTACLWQISGCCATTAQLSCSGAFNRRPSICCVMALWTVSGGRAAKPATHPPAKQIASSVIHEPAPGNPALAGARTTDVTVDQSTKGQSHALWACSEHQRLSMSCFACRQLLRQVVPISSLTLLYPAFSSSMHISTFGSPVPGPLSAPEQRHALCDQLGTCAEQGIWPLPHALPLLGMGRRIALGHQRLCSSCQGTCRPPRRLCKDW